MYTYLHTLSLHDALPSSRKRPANRGGYTVGVLDQSNYGGNLVVDGAPVGEALGQSYLKDEVASDAADGSVIIVIATDAPLSARNLQRLDRRALAGLARTGAASTNGPGDYAVDLPTNVAARRTPARPEPAGLRGGPHKKQTRRGDS